MTKVLPTNRADARSLLQQMLRFVIFGVGAALVHYSVMALLIATGLSAVLASQVGFVAGGCFSYLTNRTYTFRSRDQHRRLVARFVAVSAFGWAVNGGSLAVLVAAGLPVWLGQVVATGSVACCSFVLHRIWTFRMVDGEKPSAT
jgi:putative flippase GtrA